MEDIIRRLVQEYQELGCPHHLIRARGEWNNAVNDAFRGRNPHTIKEIYDCLKRLCHNGDFRGIGKETILNEAVNIAERMGIQYEECLQFMHSRRKYVRYVMDNENYKHLIPFEGWTLIYFLRYASNALQDAMRKQERHNVTTKKQIES